MQYDPTVGVRKQERDALRAATFQGIFEQNWSRVRHHIECVIDDPDEVSDLVSDVFSLAWSKLDVRKPLGLIWLLRVADNKLKDLERRARTEVRAMDALRSGSGLQPDSDILDAIAVRHAIDVVLTARERQMVILFYWDRLAAGEIAELLRCSQPVVFTTLSRARAKLHVELRLELESVRKISIARMADTLQTH